MAESFRPAHASVLGRGRAEPLAVAIAEATGRTLSYKDLCRRSLGVAAALAERGIGREDIVAVRLERSADATAAMVGILAAGACYLPIDPSIPGRRVTELLERSGAVAMLGEAGDAKIPARAIELSPAQWSNSPLPIEAMPAIHPDQLAYAIFTSGSTGAPKGVAMSHRGLSRLIEWQCGSGLSALRTLSFSAVGFDVSLQEVLSTLASGGTLLLCEERTRRDPAKLLETLREGGVQRIFMPPGALHRLASTAVRMDVYPTELIHVLAAGEALVITDTIVQFFQHLPGARLDNHYGPTEAHLVTASELSGDPALWPAVPAVGVAVDGMTARVLAGDFSEMEAGKTGELYAGGTGVARGYLSDPRGTAERFLPDPHADRPGAIMYRTGDLACRSENGVLAFAGRADDQIKVKGFRVEPGEVERGLCALPGVQEAAVGLRELTEGVQLLVAYVVPDGALLKQRELAAALAERLPEFMIPARFAFVSALPTTESGKIDRSALTSIPLDGEAAAATVDEADQVSLANLVRQIWSRVLGHDDFDSNEDFFDVGGDSLLAVWVVNELSRAVDGEVTLSVFLDAASVNGIARVLSERSWRPAPKRKSGELVTLRPGPPGRLLFLFHPLGGETLAYRDFARALATPVRVLGMRMTRGWGDSQFALEELAAAHLEEILAVEPTGPYRLAGWSFGGTLAYEVARQLRDRGERIGFLGLIDANPALDPTASDRNRNRYISELDRLLASLQAGKPVELRSDDAVVQLLGGVLPQGLAPAQLAGYLLTTRASLAAARAYSPRPYNGRIDLFQAGETEPGLQAELAGTLRHLAGDRLFVRMVDAGHFSILQVPAVGSLARSFDMALRDCLASEEVA